MCKYQYVITLEAVKRDGLALHYVVNRDEEIISAAVDSDPLAISAVVPDDEQIRAIKADPCAIAFASYEIRQNPEVVLQAIRLCGNLLTCAPDGDKNKEMLLAALNNQLFIMPGELESNLTNDTEIKTAIADNLVHERDIIIRVYSQLEAEG